MKSLGSKASKIVGVGRENSADATRSERHESRIMHFHAADGTGGNEALPFFIGRWRIQQKRNHRFDFVNFARGNGGRKSQTPGGNRASHHIPKFGNILPREIDQFTRSKEPCEDVNCQSGRAVRVLN